MQASARISARRSGPIEISGKVGELTQQESKMSSECSSDETVIYVMKPAENEQMARKRSKTDDEEHAVHDLDDDLNDDDSQERGAGLEIGDARKVLPKIYSAVNSVSSQDSGINLSFHESDKSLDSMDLKRSSSAESNSTNSYGRKPRTCSMTALPSNKSNSCNRQQAVRQNDDFSEDEECSSNDLKEEEDGGNGDAASSFGTKGDGDGKVEACRPQWHCPPKNIWKPAVEAMQEFDMIRDNDRVLVCLSTNCKSSLSLLHALHQYRFYVRSKGVDFEIGAATVDPSGSNPVELAGYLESLNVPYFHEEQEEEEEEGKRGDNRGLEEGVDASGACSFCDRGTRARLYAIAKRHGYNVLAVGQHLDDLTEGFLVSVFHGGKLRTMKAHYYVRRQDLRVVRPFVYVREKALRQFVESKKLLVSRGIDLPEVSIPSSSSSQIFIYLYLHLVFNRRPPFDPVAEAETKQGADTSTTRARLPSPLLVPENRSPPIDRRPRATDRSGPRLARGEHAGEQFERLEQRLLQLGREQQRPAEEAAANSSEGELDLVGDVGPVAGGGGAGRERGDGRGAGPLRETRREMGFQS